MYTLTIGALWSFLVNKQQLCLNSVLLTKTHCVYLKLCLSATCSPSYNIIVNIHVYLLAVLFFVIFVVEVLHIGQLDIAAPTVFQMRVIMHMNEINKTGTHSSQKSSIALLEV